MRAAIILAGGWGERLWPLSRPLRPKHIVPWSRIGSLLENTVSDIAPLLPPERLYIVTSRQLQPILQAQLPHVPASNIFAEPHRRNTSGALAYATAKLMNQPGCDPSDLTLAVLTADHIVEDTDRFRETISEAMALAEREQTLVCIGIRPTRPETGFGYIEMGEEPGSVERFVEKPDAERAHSMVNSDRFLWNSGMLFGTVATFVGELRQAAPTIADAIDSMADAMRRADEREVDNVFENLEDLSVDYALLEKCRNLRVVEGAFGWDNLNAWDAFAGLSERDPNGNTTLGESVLIDCEDCLVYNAADSGEMTVAALGLSGMAVIVTSDAVLVMPTDRAQEVRRITEELRRQGRRDA